MIGVPWEIINKMRLLKNAHCFTKVGIVPNLILEISATKILELRIFIRPPLACLFISKKLHSIK